MNCRCGHEQAKHHHGNSCTAIIDDVKLRYCKCEQFREVMSSQIQNLKGEEMATKKPHTLLVVRYEPTAKNGEELLAKDNTGQAAAMYRALVAAKKPLTIKECYAACEGKLESAAAWERLGKNLNSSLFALREGGFVKKSEKREEVDVKPRKAKSANGAAKPRKRKARKLAVVKETTDSASAAEDYQDEASA